MSINLKLQKKLVDGCKFKDVQDMIKTKNYPIGLSC